METCIHCGKSEIEKPIGSYCACDESACAGCAIQCHKDYHGAEEWEDCWNCQDGYTGHDCGEDTCCCLEPEDNVPCDICKGRGGWNLTQPIASQAVITEKK